MRFALTDISVLLCVKCSSEKKIDGNHFQRIEHKQSIKLGFQLCKINRQYFSLHLPSFGRTKYNNNTVKITVFTSQTCIWNIFPTILKIYIHIQLQKNIFLFVTLVTADDSRFYVLFRLQMTLYQTTCLLQNSKGSTFLWKCSCRSKNITFRTN